jgi:hypothetical protein
MAARTAGRTSDKADKGLQAAVSGCVWPQAVLLRWLGDQALGLGLSQEELARRLNGVDGGKLNGANVAQHFAAKKPSAKIIWKYARALGYSDEYADLYVASSLTHEQVDKWVNDLRDQFETHQSWFNPDAFVRVMTKLRSSQAVMHAALRYHALGSLAGSYAFPRPGWMRLPAEFYWFGQTALPVVDIRDELLPREQGDGFLYDIYLNAMAFYGNERAANDFVDAVAAILKIQGYDVVTMRERVDVHKAEFKAFEKIRDRQPAPGPPNLGTSCES